MMDMIISIPEAWPYRLLLLLFRLAFTLLRPSIIIHSFGLNPLSIIMLMSLSQGEFECVIASVRSSNLSANGILVVQVDVPHKLDL